MVRQMVRRSAVVALGLAALALAVFSTAPTQAGAVDYFTAVGCQVNDYQCLYAHNGIDPNAPQYESPRVYAQLAASYAYPYYGYGYGANPYSYGYGYGSNPYFYGIGNVPYYGNGYNPYYGYGYGFPYYGYGYNPYYTSGTSSSPSPSDIARVTGYCNIGAGVGCYPTK